MTAPVALHRFLFGRHEKDVLVRTGDVFAKAGMAAMGLTLVTVVVLIFGVVVNDVAGIVAGTLVLVFYALALGGRCPLRLLRRADDTGSGVGVSHTDWLLTKSERANAQTVLDARHDGRRRVVRRQPGAPADPRRDLLRRAPRAHRGDPRRRPGPLHRLGRATPTSS